MKKILAMLSVFVFLGISLTVQADGTFLCASQQGSTSSYQFLNPPNFSGVTIVSVKPYVSRLLIRTQFPIGSERTIFDGTPSVGQRISFTENNVIITAYTNQNVGNDCGALSIRAE